MAASYRVVKSLENEAADRCVDIFQRHDGTFGFEECRRDQEDAVQWFPLDKYAGLTFKTEEDALAEAKTQVAWLAKEER